MKSKNLFTIGELSKICDLPVSALRHYDKVGVLKPVFVDPESGYRYYDDDSIMRVSLLSVYKRYGFSLEKIGDLLRRNDLSDLRDSFTEKNKALDAEICYLQMTKCFFSEWITLINEAESILNGADPGISIRYIHYDGMRYRKPEILPYMKLKHLLVYTEGIKNGMSFTYGPLFLGFPSTETRLSGDISQVDYYIAVHPDDPNDRETVTLGGYSAITAFHKGSYDTIGETYDKMFAWAKEHNFELRGDCLERYVTDYWSSYNEDLFVTEVMLPLK